MTPPTDEARATDFADELAEFIEGYRWADRGALVYGIRYQLGRSKFIDEVEAALSVARSYLEDAGPKVVKNKDLRFVRRIQLAARSILEEGDR